MAKRQKSNSANACETRDTLIRFAARTFGTQGYSATTMRNIADLAGIEAASIYYHFASKEELVEAVMEQGAERIVHHLNERLDALGPGATAEQRFRAAVLGQMLGLVMHGDFAVAHSRLLGQLPDTIRERQVIRREHHQTLWNGLLEDLRAAGKLREDVDIHLARVHILGGINSIQSWFNPRKGSLERIADQLCTMFFSGVSPPSP
ncbi:TetR/AcrR family transcriptional regulator [Burkholderia pyrrocinia]|uniref:TetR/AcrR family transcriptional regulator n=1 Tax=Burkholderia pyrrocinia TaxID=60550 RepID=A0A2Z5N1P2_BURPY|nr:TetR/AcrR family transcriptional regulator [Burkholderia pyrrocinia]AXF22834.1 TetR/AcrR family transcriptional regulator [Burkholderia pyrrocinia]